MSTPVVERTPDRTVARWVDLLDVTLIAVLAVVAIAPFRPLFISARVVVLAAGAVLMALVVNVLVRRLAASFAVLIGLVTIAAYVVFAVFHVGTNRGSALGDVWHGVSGSWADLLTATIPTGTSPELASLPVLLAWTAAEAGILLARTRSASAPIIPALLAFGATLLFTGEQGAASPFIVAGLIVGALLVVLLRANLLVADRSATRQTGGGFGLDRSGRSLPVGQLRLGAIVVVVVTAGAVVAATLAPITSDHDRVDLHDRYEPPLDVTDALSPLSTVRAELNDDSTTPLFTVRFGGIPTGTDVSLLRAATLDTYDGTVWSTDATFARAGTELPAGEPVTGSTVTIEQHVTLDASYTSSFLPSLDRPVSAAGAVLGFDRDSGMLVAGSNDRDGLTYDVTSDVPVVDPVVARQAEAGNDPAFSRLSLPPPAAGPQRSSSSPQHSRRRPIGTTCCRRSRTRSDHRRTSGTTPRRVPVTASVCSSTS